jgi:beta-barrel assembly-enhancing protease
MTRDQQMQLGFQAASQVYQQMPVLPDSSPETQYIRKLGQKLVATIPSEYSWPFEFHVVPQKEINAFALPGGPMFVNIGTITAASNEAELAGVMAHEMSHVYMQHSAKQAGKAEPSSAPPTREGWVHWHKPASSLAQRG